MSLKDAFKKITNNLADEKREKAKKQANDQLSKKAFTSKSGANRDTGKHSNSITPSKSQSAAALKNTSASTGVPKGNTEKGVSATKVTADNFNGTGKSASQNGYVKLKQGAGLYNDDDMGFSNLKAGSVRMSDSQKGNNNSKPKGALNVIKMSNIQSKHMDKTVQNTINAHNANVERGTVSTVKTGNAPMFSNTLNAADKSPKKQLVALNKDLPNIVQNLKNPATSAQTIQNLSGETIGKQIRDKIAVQEEKKQADKKDINALLSGIGRELPGARQLASAAFNKISTSEQTEAEKEKKAEEDKKLAEKADERKAQAFKSNMASINFKSPVTKGAEDIIGDAWRDTPVKAKRDPITVQSVNGKAPKGLMPGDKVVTNAGTYTIVAVLSDGSYITDSKKTIKDDSGKTWEVASDTKNTKYNTYSYDDPTAKREVQYKEPSVLARAGNVAKAVFNDALDKDGKKEKKYYDDLEKVNDKLQEDFSNMSTTGVAEYYGSQHNHHYTALDKDSSYFESNPDAAAILKFTPGEKAMYNYAYEKYGSKTADKYFEYVVNKRGYNKEIAQEANEAVTAGLAKDPTYNKELNEFGAKINNEFEPYKNNNFRDSGLMRYLAYGKDSDYFMSNPEAAKIFDFTDAQRKRYNYVYQTYGAKDAKKYFDYVVSTMEDNTGLNKGAAAVGSLYSTLVNSTAGALAGVGNLAQGAKNALGIGKYKPIDQYSAWNTMSNSGNLVRSTISSNIKNPALRIGYNGVMSIADMAAQAFTLGAAGSSASKLITAAMSTNSANQTILDTLSRGGSQQQAFVNGFVNGVLEYASESPAVEGVFNVARGLRPVKDVKSFTLSLLKQMGAEGLGEGFANVTQNLADQIIMGDKSNFGQTVQQYEQQGSSHSEAVKQATMDMYVKQTAEAMATGALAGGIMGGAATGINTVSAGRNINSNTAYAKDLANTAKEIGLDGQYAQTAQAITEGKDVTALDAANLKGAIQEHYLEETRKDIAKFYNYVGLEAPHRLATTFGRVSNRDETGFNNQKFTDAWLKKSTDILMQINQYKANPKNTDLRTNIKEYLKNSNALLYSGVLSEDGQFAAAVRAQANEVLNNIPASAAGQNIVSNDSDLYAEDTENADAENNDADIDTQSADSKTVDTGATTQSVGEDAAPVIDITDDVVPLSESASEVAESNNATTEKVASSDEIATQNATSAAEQLTEPAAESAAVQSTASETQPVNATEPKKETKSESKSQTKKEPKTVDDYAVGQKKGSTVTYHKSAEVKNNSPLVKKAIQAVGLNLDYDLVREEPRSRKVTFIKVDDFDGYAEPTIESELVVTFDKSGEFKEYHENEYAPGRIIPDKSEYVPLNYTGFDVAAQKAREDSWKNVLDDKGEHRKYESSRISNPDYFYDMFGDIVSRGELSEDISKSDGDEEVGNTKQAETDLNGYSIEESPDGNTFTVYDPEGYYEDDFKSRREAEEYVRRLSGNDKKDKKDDKKEVKSETETETETETESENISDSEGFNEENRENSANPDNKTEKNEVLNDESFNDDEFELIEWEDLDEEEPVMTKIDMDKIRSNRAIASEIKQAFDVLYDTPKSANQMGKLVKEIYQQTVENGYYDLSGAADMFENEIENNRYVGEDLRTPEEKDFYQAVTHGNFKVDDAVKKEITDYGDWQKENKNIILKSSPNGTQSIDNFYSSLETEYPDVFYGSSKITGNATTEGDMLVELVAAARDIQDKMYTREGDVGTAFEGFNTHEIGLIWADKLGELLSKEKIDNKSGKAKTEGKTNESTDKKKSTGRTEKSTSEKESSGESKSRTKKEDGNKSEEGRAESKDTEEKVSETEPTVLKARGKKQQSEPNKDNPLRGSLNDLKARQNYGKTDEAIRSIKDENRAVAENIGSIIKEIAKRFHVNVYAKRYRNMGKNTLGWFDNMHSQIHTQEKEQLGVTIHELGHKLDKDFGLNGSAGVQDMLDNVPGLKQEMQQRGYTPAEMQMETIADFVWKYLSEPDVAWEMGSYARNRNFYETFELALDKKTLKDVKAIRADILAFTTKNTTERMRGQVRTREEVRAEDRIHIHDLKTPNTVFGKMIKGFDKVYGNFQENFVDSTWAASKVVKDIEKASGRKLTPKENLQLALEFSGSNASVTDTLITRGFIKPNGELTGRESFASIIKETEDKGAKAGRTSKQNAFDDFALYLIARHAIDRERMGQTTMSQDATGGDNIAAYEQIIRDMDSKYGGLFEEQSNAVYEWYDAFMRAWMVDTGLLSEAKYEVMRGMYPHYVPMFRVMDTRHANGQVSKGVNPLKHNSLKGSTREIYNPIENLMIQVNNIVKAYHNNEIGATIHRLWTSEDAAIQDGIAQFVTKEQVKLERQQVQTEEIKDRLQNKLFDHIYNNVWSASNRGEYSRMSPEEQAQVRDELTRRDLIDNTIDDTITQFVPTDNGLDQNVVVALVDGEKHYYRITDEYLAQAITSVQPTEYMFKHIAKLTRAFSALTTSQNPIFAISNAIRDFQHGWVYTDAEHWYQNFTYPAEWVVALGQSLKNEFSSKHQSDMYKQYKSTTGFDHKYMADSDTLGEVMKSIHRSRNPLVWAAHFIDALNTAVESAPRYVAYKRKFGATGEVMTAGKAAREATVNFNRKGTKTKRLGQAVPFLGAAVAGVNQFVTLLTSKETLTTKNGRLKLARAFATQAIPAILLAFLNSGWFGDDDEKRKEYDELSEYTKNNYWVFKWGDTWVKLPRDREISALFGTLFQNIALDKIYPEERDSTVTKEFIGYLKDQLIPTVSPTGWALIQARANKTWYGTSLVSSSSEDLLKNPETYMDVTDESTSEIATWMAGIINKGPEMMRESLGVLATPKGVDYVLDQLTGGLGDVILPLTTPTERWAGLGESLKAKYTFNEDKSSRYTSEAYDIKDKLTALNSAGKITDEEAEWLQAFKKTMSKSSGDDPDYKTVGDYFADIRAYRNDLSMSYSDRAAKMNEAYEHIADMTYDLVRAYKGGGTAQGSYAEKLIPSDIDTVGFTAETYTAAFNRINKGDESAKKLALAADTELDDKQKAYLSEDILGKQYANYANSYKKMAEAGVTPEQITKAYDMTRNYNSDKAKALAVISAGGDNAELIAMAVSGASDNTYNSNLTAYRGAVKSGVTGEMYDSVIAAADTIAKAGGHSSVTKDSLRAACKQAGYNSMQTMYIMQMRFPSRSSSKKSKK